MKKIRLFTLKGKIMYHDLQFVIKFLPHRPLPRGLIKYEEAVKVINITLLLMIIYAFVLGLRYDWSVAVMFGIQVSMT